MEKLLTELRSKKRMADIDFSYWKVEAYRLSRELAVAEARMRVYAEQSELFNDQILNYGMFSEQQRPTASPDKSETEASRGNARTSQGEGT